MNMKVMLISTLALCIVGCAKTAEETAQSSNKDIRVDKLFTIDGCNVYRFEDAGSYRYLTTCQGGVQGVVPCGKGCFRHDEIGTAIKP